MSDSLVIVIAIYQLLFGVFCGYIAWGRRYFAAKRVAYRVGWNDALNVAKQAIRDTKAEGMRDERTRPTRA